MKRAQQLCIARRLSAVAATCVILTLAIQVLRMFEGYGMRAGVDGHWTDRGSFRQHQTGRLDLHALAMEHLAPVHAVYGDPATWIHLPQGRHTTAEATAEMIAKAESSWRDHGLGYWSLVLRAQLPGSPLRPGDVVGTGGVSAVEGDLWNLGYRLTPDAWGHGLAGEVVREALACARTVAPSRPVVARILSENSASRRVAERAGMILIREEIESSGPAAGQRRLTFSDRQLS